jgi:hypothetical protein
MGNVNGDGGGVTRQVFLGLLGSKPAEWKGQLEEQRAAYDVLHKRYMVDPHAEGRELDPAINNPLSQAEEVPYLSRGRPC